MSNRRVKSLALDEDDYDDYEDYDDDYGDDGGDNELSAEDKELLRQGTIKVRAALGPAFPATENEIQEALWHYYYDIGKSVTYLKNKQKPAPIATKKEAHGSKSKLVLVDSSSASSSRRGGHDSSGPSRFKNGADEHQDPTTSAPCSSPFSPADFFKDSPWLRIPEHRKSEIIITPLYPRLRLLGGASNTGKVSKLAVLAAKRRQKESEKSDAQTTANDGSQQDYLSSLNKLRISQPSRAKSGPAAASDSLAAEPRSQSQERNHSSDLNMQIESKQIAAERASDGSLVVDQLLRGHPSPFASIMTSRDADTCLLSSTDFFSIRANAKSFNFTEPSPDDIVTKAQNAKAAGSATAKARDTTRAKSSLTGGIHDLSIQEAPKIKSKIIDVLAEYKKMKRKNAANFVVIGHVDAGKSTLMGRLLFDLKAVDQRTLDKYRQEAERIGKGSFAFAWVLDQGSEERARGVTIDIATNKFETDKTSFTILDAPGHRDFVPNMIAGASQADFAVLVIDASTGNFESGLKGQTKEHALLVRSIGVQRIIVAVNKMDVAEWSQERFNEIRQQMAAFLSSAGFQSKNVTFVPCSGLGGQNILTRASDPRSSWYTGPTLVEELDKAEPSTHALDKPLRMNINDVFRGGVQNPLSVSGRLDAGTIQVGEQVVIMPSGEEAQIRSLQVDEESQDWAVAGQNVVLNLTDIDPIHLKSGDVLCSPLSPIQNIAEFKAKILAFDHLTPMNVDVHKGRLHVPGRISQLVGVLDKSSGTVVKKKPKIVQPGSVVRVIVQLDQAVPLEPPSRIVLRANGETVGAGLIE
ncbi:translation elongation factor Tu [Cladophialophora bantiana CBS 173.52]|uniref:Elongation factor 1 alpha-like protein n=1 Tax=Cladophialophora bantiana (strain ATCC 10958 / CBS 173.52 / CDC B-1940 / NIH 8579) TaxID=1442370 RepID=A0A0D2G3X8_CLAB1|nr:translation elongation factor Tu [Cladophialophora bantiana CBS 173.52]KIW93372.1 translation elongation factor Tu [Cladophialophora bantiana CBS 173.52]